MEKDYRAESLEDIVSSVQRMDRSQLLVEKPKVSGRNTNDFTLPFITTYSTKDYSIKKLIYKHWHILQNNRILVPLLLVRPQAVYRGVPSLRDQIASNILDPPKRASYWHNLTGYYPCRRCLVCTINGYRDRRTDSFVSMRLYLKHSLLNLSLLQMLLLQCLCDL